MSLKSPHSLHVSVVVPGTAHFTSPIIAVPHPTHISVIAKHATLVWHIATRVVAEIGWVASKIARIRIKSALQKCQNDNSSVSDSHIGESFILFFSLNPRAENHGSGTIQVSSRDIQVNIGGKRKKKNSLVEFSLLIFTCISLLGGSLLNWGVTKDRTGTMSFS